MTAEALLQQNTELQAEVERLSAEREKYRKLYLDTLEMCRKLERGLVGQKSERWRADDSQLTMDILGELLAAAPQDTEQSPEEAESAPADSQDAPARPATKSPSRSNGRQRPPETLPRVEIEIVPEEVEREGLDAFDRIGEDVSEVIERRPASVVIVRTIRPKFVRKLQAPGREAAVEEPTVLQSEPLELPIVRGAAGPGFLADTLVRRWQDHLPLNRLESIYARDGLPLARSTICGWHLQLAELARPLLEAMWADARGQPYLCVDATGVLVQAKEKCRRGHFWVVVAPERHVLFGFSKRHNSEAVDALLGGYDGYIVADAHTVYDHLYGDGGATEVACWAHARRYFFKVLGSEPELARKALGLIGALFHVEKGLASVSPKKRLAARQRKSAVLVKHFYEWCKNPGEQVLEDTPLEKAIGYATNQREALERFLTDGRLPLHNNVSELNLRRQAIGRKNWLFLGSEDGAEANTTFVSLLASCQLHGIEPWAYLRDLLCLLPSWTQTRLLELSPAQWQVTSARPDVQRALEANRFRAVTLPDGSSPIPPQM